MKTPQGNSRNFAFINFTDEESVPYAQSMLDGILLFGRPLSVRFRDGSVHKARELEENERRARQEESKARANQAALLQRLQQQASASALQQQCVPPNRLLTGQLGFSAQPFQLPYNMASSSVPLQQQLVQNAFQYQSAYQSGSAPFAQPHARQHTFPTYSIPTHISSSSGVGGVAGSSPYTSQRSAPNNFHSPTHRDERSWREFNASANANASGALGSFNSGRKRERSRSPQWDRERSKHQRHQNSNDPHRHHVRS